MTQLEILNNLTGLNLKEVIHIDFNCDYTTFIVLTQTDFELKFDLDDSIVGDEFDL